MKYIQLPCIVLILLTFVPGIALAAKQYRCEGRVQYRPCEQGFKGQGSIGTGVPAATIVRAQPRTSVHQPNLFAEITESRFERITHRDGVWKGKVRGNGIVHLHLEILRKGLSEAVRYMGSVPLANKSTTFAFRAVAPTGRDWSWRILAEPKPL